MKHRLLCVVALMLAVCFVALAADVAGKWTAQVPSRSGQARETTFLFKVDGTSLSGTMTGYQGQQIAISNGKISGDTISFVVTMERGGNTIKQTYTGKVAGNQIQFKREGGQGPAREFVAKRAN